jgi:hypothetical protein
VSTITDLPDHDRPIWVITIAGMRSVIFILGRRAERPLTAKERSGLFHLLLTASGALLFSLVVAAGLATSSDESAVWRTGCGLVGAYGFLGASRAAIQELRGEHSLPPLFAWPIPIGGIVLAVANLLVAGGFFTHLAAVVCVSLLIWFLLVALVYFVSLVLPGEDAA